MRSLRALCALVLVCAAAAAGAQGFYLKPGDRVVFYGDSITDQRLYTLYTEAYVVTRFPKLPVTFIHSGWGGDRVTGGGGGPIDLRLDRDVIAYKPTVMTIMLGMNDGSYRAFDQGIFDTYANGYKHILDKMHSAEPNLRFTLIEPSPFDDVTRQPGFPGGYNATLLRYAEFVKQLATERKATVADQNTGVVAALQKADATDHTNALKIIPDRVHPGPGGHWLMAEALLKAWNAPSVVSAVILQIGGPVMHVDSKNTKVEAHVDGQRIEWTQTDNALPLPIDMNDAATALAVRSSDIVDALDQQSLKVTGLTGPRYSLKIDGAEVGTFSGAELANGINLAQMNTPMLKQSMEVLSLTRMHNDLHFTRWRVVQVPHQNELQPHYLKVMDALDKAEADIVAQQRAAAQPKPHHFELTPAG